MFHDSSVFAAAGNLFLVPVSYLLVWTVKSKVGRSQTAEGVRGFFN